MIIVKHSRKEKIYVYASEYEYKNSFYGPEKSHLASFYFKWGYGNLNDVVIKCNKKNFQNESETIRKFLAEYFLSYSARKYLPIEFCVNLDRFYSSDFKKIIEIKSLLRLT